MKTIYVLFLTLISSIVLTTTVFAKDCPESISLDFGKLEVREFNEKYLHSDYQSQKEDALNLSNKKITLDFQDKEKTTCFFSDGYYSASLKQTKKYIYFSLIKGYSTARPDSDTYIYANDFIINKRLEANTTSSNPYSFGKIDAISHYSYYSTCGFTECTDEDDKKIKIGTYSRLNVKWNTNALITKCRELSLDIVKSQISYSNGTAGAKLQAPEIVKSKKSVLTYSIKGTPKKGLDFEYLITFNSKGRNKCDSLKSTEFIKGTK